MTILRMGPDKIKGELLFSVLGVPSEGRFVVAGNNPEPSFPKSVNDAEAIESVLRDYIKLMWENLGVNREDAL